MDNYSDPVVWQAYLDSRFIVDPIPPPPSYVFDGA